MRTHMRCDVLRGHGAKAKVALRGERPQGAGPLKAQWSARGSDVELS